VGRGSLADLIGHVFRLFGSYFHVRNTSTSLLFELSHIERFTRRNAFDSLHRLKVDPKAGYLL
jgi:hypothetical protein